MSTTSEVPMSYDQWQERTEDPLTSRAIEVLEANDVPLPVVTVESVQFGPEGLVAHVSVDASEFRRAVDELIARIEAGEDVPVGPDAIAGCVPLAVPEGREEPQP